MTVLRERITQCYDALTSSQRQLADYVTANHRGSVFMTAKQLGAATGLSDAAVVRFAQALGFTGFQELRGALREELLSRLGNVGVAEASRELARGAELAESVAELGADLVNATARLNAWPMYERVAQKVCEARRVWVTGHGTTYPTAAYLAMTLNSALDNVDLMVVGPGDLVDRLRGVTSADVLIGIGYVRYLPYTVDVLKIGREQGAHVVAITDKPTSPLARVAADVFLVARDSFSFHWSQIGTIAVADALVAVVAAQDEERTRRLLRASDDLLRRQGLWRDEVADK
jgi:DNA-binding MurR/RpiR family transcriptional regulator